MYIQVHVYTGTHLVSECMEFSTFSHTVTHMNMYMYITCSVHRLTWHGIIPSDEVWVKVGGEKGAKTFKMSFQIAHTPNPNSVENTCVFTVFEAKDTTANLLVALERYKPQISALQTQSWR